MSAHGIIAIRRRIVRAIQPVGSFVSGHPRMSLLAATIIAFGVIGAVVDYNNAVLAKADLQNALDSAARSAVGDLDARSDEEVKARVQHMIQTRLLTETDIANVTVAVDRKARRVRCRATARVDTTVTSLIGPAFVEIAASSDASADSTGKVTSTH
ncbi:Tad domain-containing protein [Prosthecomicrobium hirschii]|jgi:Flp pilus assembly protein TadG|uniref:Putative Flp pilus-assembly TadG-like N-terminal domain-containing protein n=1 Tax=Prosthecodimorpha hirschii TaxID=665126 RepID=A0A0P6VVS9_9HYPH|nr:Tad domain-containing protein [Prosthecomicrobium hirschii]KPL50999.1 hypothetical protein ABB55_01145 [Prosthecomicrobium hirschii]MCW1839179.1 Tad domain-containing protein [Prosthecomicrobium hirschii]TPQ49635.1 hypothetical protein C2U72_17505 [Prosthecomicrobium hirschii]